MSYLGDCSSSSTSSQHQQSAGDGKEDNQLPLQPSPSPTHPQQPAQQLLPQQSQQSPQNHQLQNRLLQSSQWSKSYDSVINYWNTTGTSAAVAATAGYQQNYAGGYSTPRQSFPPTPYYYDRLVTSPLSASSTSPGSPPPRTQQPAVAASAMETGPPPLQHQPEQRYAASGEATATAAARSPSGKQEGGGLLFCLRHIQVARCLL